ncbi:MAG: hypothetical protein H6574_00075 [Lewinellaceae bacterium]|nr:hypothetical protein [Lewinellaceae bacterium]
MKTELSTYKMPNDMQKRQKHFLLASLQKQERQLKTNSCFFYQWANPVAVQPQEAPKRQQAIQKLERTQPEQDEDEARQTVEQIRSLTSRSKRPAMVTLFGNFSISNGQTLNLGLSPTSFFDPPSRPTIDH